MQWQQEAKPQATTYSMNYENPSLILPTIVRQGQLQSATAYESCQSATLP